MLKQSHRVKEFIKFLKHNPIAKGKFKIDLKKQRLFPLLVTWLEEGIIEENGVLIVPVWKLNGFLVDINSYL
jgi:hypothetical protein